MFNINIWTTATIMVVIRFCKSRRYFLNCVRWVSKCSCLCYITNCMYSINNNTIIMCPTRISPSFSKNDISTWVKKYSLGLLFKPLNSISINSPFSCNGLAEISYVGYVVPAGLSNSANVGYLPVLFRCAVSHKPEPVNALAPIFVPSLLEKLISYIYRYYNGNLIWEYL